MVGLKIVNKFDIPTSCAKLRVYAIIMYGVFELNNNFMMQQLKIFVYVLYKKPCFCIYYISQGESKSSIKMKRCMPD